MAGIYIHIPFCKKACYYCDFHFSSYLALKEPLIDALVKEIELQKSFLEEPVETIYFGGGTPSILEAREVERILNTIYKYHAVSPAAEITLEANPDDLNADKLKAFKILNINRLSIGMQTFNNALLKFMNRIHNAGDSLRAFHLSRNAGFDNINCDLIYGIPGENRDSLTRDLQTLNDMHPEHISAYCLTIEDKTVFGVWRKHNKLKEVEEDHAAWQFESVHDFLSTRDYASYEISNFSLPGFHSRHNSAYWKDKPFLGLGPGAHSYDGENRFFNIGNNSLYIKSIENVHIPATVVNLAPDDRVNEYILTSLRTIWGCDLDYIRQKHNMDLLQYNGKSVISFIEQGLLSRKDNTIYLTVKGRALADFISSKLFI